MRCISISILAAALVALCMGPRSAAQEKSAADAPPVVRVLRDFDGAVAEVVRGQGVLTCCHEPRLVRDGLGSLRVTPPEKGRFWGVTLDRVDARHARALACEIYHTGNRPAWLLVKIHDGSGRGREHRFEQRVDVNPGWNHVEVALTGARTRGGSALDFTKLWRIVIDRGGPKDAFHVDHVRLLFDPPASARKLAARLGREFQKGADEERTAVVRETARLPEAVRVALLLKWLKPGLAPWLQVPILRELARCESAETWRVIRKGYARSKGPMRARLVALLGASKAADARAVARGVAADAGAESGLRIAALVAATRRGRADLVAAAAAIGADAAWRLRAAAVCSLRLSRAPEAVDALIAVLERPKNARVALDAYEALVDLTGQDYGYEVVQWKGWWQANRDKPLPPPSMGRRAPRGGYASFYGIPVRGTRMVFVLDVSGSMRDPLRGKKVERHVAESDYLKGKRLATRLDLAKEELVHTLEQLPATTHYAVGFFNDEVMWVHDAMRPATKANVADTAKRVRRISAAQKTNVYEAILQSVEAGWARSRTGHEDGPDTVFLVGDGVPSAGRVTRFHLLADWFLDFNRTRFVRLNTILVGRSGQVLLRRLAEESWGRFVDVGG